MFTKNTINKTKKAKFTAYIGLDRNWWHYYSNYKSAIDFLVEGIENNLSVNTVSSPLLFLIRHSLELGFKANILKLEMVSTARPKLKLKGPNSHSLESLYDIFKAHLVEIQKNHEIEISIKGVIEDYLKTTEQLKNILHELDKGSYNFRYPVDTENNFNFERNAQINIADIVEAFYELQPFLIFTDQVLYEHGVFGIE